MRKQALHYLEHNEFPDLIIMDVDMPEMKRNRDYHESKQAHRGQDTGSVCHGHV